jgi:hypothetical protein
MTCFRFCLASLFFLLPLAAFAGPLDPPATIPDTGQTQCYDEDGNVISCAGTGQDGEFSNNPMSFTSLAGGIMVQDNVTGLIWEVKTDDGSIHDKDNKYTWCDSNPATNGGHAGTCGDGTDTEYFIDALNNAAFGGYTDWRLPSREELRSIVDYAIPYPGPTIDTGYFPNTVSSYYWSSTTYANSTNGAWGVNFNDGHDSYGYKSNGRYVRAVRGGQ